MAKTTVDGGIPLDDAPLDDDLAEALLAEGVDVLVAGEPDPTRVVEPVLQQTSIGSASDRERPGRSPQSPVETPDPNADIAGMTYEAARDELVTVVARLEAGGESLEGSLALWERGEALAARCQEWLDGAQAKLTEATDGSGDE